MKKDFDYELSSSFEYACKGEIAEATFITFHAPTSRNMQQCAMLKQSFYRALSEQQEKASDPTGETVEDKGDKVINGAEIMDLIMISKDVELVNVLIAGKELFASKGVAMVDGETPLTKPLVDNMSQDDLEKALGEYLANFILASFLQKMNKK